MGSRKPPKRIWLQWHPNYEMRFPSYHTVPASSLFTSDNDVEYVRVDRRAKPKPKKRRK